ncbi:hypothetical protein [Bacillus cereus]|uniref:hypothetical protein n=1 Tax=Bacillus cereus TaxID=1396 RepID=UPI0018798CF6|nr:hypothetical protein [Bacillus cereus]
MFALEPATALHLAEHIQIEQLDVHSLHAFQLFLTTLDRVDVLVNTLVMQVVIVVKKFELRNIDDNLKRMYLVRFCMGDK